MKTLAAVLFLAGAIHAQEGDKTQTQATTQLSDADRGTLGGFVAEKIDASPAADELERAILGKMDELRKAHGSQAEKKEESASPKKSKKKKSSKKPATSAPDTIKNGLTESDRQALGTIVVTEIQAGHRGEALAGAIKKELERLRAERVKASSTSDSGKKKKKKTTL
jgi:hypothetical protein